VSLFESDHLAGSQDDADRPLAERMRPATLGEYAGQEHILAPGKPLRSQIDRDHLDRSFCGDHRAWARLLSRESSRG